MFGQGFTFSYYFSIIIFLRFSVKKNVLLKVWKLRGLKRSTMF